MKGIVLEQYCVQQHLKSTSVHKNTTVHAVFNSFWSSERNHDSATTYVHSKRIIEL